MERKHWAILRRLTMSGMGLGIYFEHGALISIVFLWIFVNLEMLGYMVQRLYDMHRRYLEGGAHD